MSFNVGLSLSDTASETTATARAARRPRCTSSATTTPPTVATPEVWNADEAVLVTGGAGFVGSHVAEHLLRRGEKVLVIDELNAYYDVSKKQDNIRLLERVGGRNFRFFKGDICDKAFLAEVEKSCKFPKRVVHLAARAGVRPSIDDPFVYVHSNVEGTTRLLRTGRAQAHGADAKFVFASQQCLRREQEATIQRDGRRGRSSKPVRGDEKGLRVTRVHVPSLIWHARGWPPFLHGLRAARRPDMAPLKFVDKVSSGVPIDRYGDGSSSRDYTYIDDIVDGVVRALDTPLRLPDLQPRATVDRRA